MADEASTAFPYGFSHAEFLDNKISFQEHADLLWNSARSKDICSMNWSMICVMLVMLFLRNSVVRVLKAKFLALRKNESRDMPKNSAITKQR
ncbi:hypothetical protein T10_4569 [Trichinella papuae]|uniref:Uncharacterized protein n=1 Tax=Trichinella papuae TaxID=268474 RepID=A0A0V1M5Y6_9BILA|nr:hypothetical protein T10_4569 [Trichinella papuae]